MPRADVVVIGAGLAGLSCAAELAERGARVFLAAKGMATTHWTHGGLDVAAPPGAASARDGVARLARIDGHPYALLGAEVPDAVRGHRERLSRAGGLTTEGDLEAALVPIPTAVGTLRPASILPAAQAAALEPWGGDGLLLVGYRRFRDAWATYAARNLAALSWSGGPREVRAAEVEIPRTSDLHNLNGRSLALLFDDPVWRRDALRAVRAAVPPGAWRIGLPATLGARDHARAFAEAEATLGHRIIELPSLPPSVPGIRLFETLRAAILRAGGRLQIGFGVASVERHGRRVLAVHLDAAARSLRIGGDEFVLATGGVAGEGIRAEPDGSLVERVFGLPVVAPPRERWFSDDPLSPHPIEALGIATDPSLRPVDAAGDPVLENVRIIGSNLAGMRYLAERCGDGVALASAHRAATSLASGRMAA